MELANRLTLEALCEQRHMVQSKFEPFCEINLMAQYVAVSASTHIPGFAV